MTQPTVDYGGRTLPVIGAYDVAVVGGGSAGSACAIRCAQLGFSVVVIDRYAMLGGSATNATVCPMMPTHVAHRGVFAQIEQELRASGEATRDGTTAMLWFAPERLGMVYERLLTGSGGEVLYDAALVDVLDAPGAGSAASAARGTGAGALAEGGDPDGHPDGATTGARADGANTTGRPDDRAGAGDAGGAARPAPRRLRHLVVMTAQGMVGVEAGVMVDASGDAVLARLAGVPTRSGDEAGANQVCSLRFTMGGIDVDAYRDYCLSLGDEFSPLKSGFFFESAMVAGRGFALEPVFRQGVAEGLLSEGDLRYYQAFSVPGKPGVMAFNCPHIPSLVSNTTARGRSAAIVEAHAAIGRLARFLRVMMPGFSRSFLVGVAPMLGVRESWRIDGVYRLTEQDYAHQARFDDGLVRGDWFIDVHSQSKGLFHQKGYQPGDYYEIPYRCFIAPQTSNLLVAGRCISTTFLMQASVRIIPTVIDMGDAVGCACALSAASGVPPLELSGEEVRRFADASSPLG